MSWSSIYCCDYIRVISLRTICVSLCLSSCSVVSCFIYSLFCVHLVNCLCHACPLWAFFMNKSLKFWSFLFQNGDFKLNASIELNSISDILQTLTGLLPASYLELHLEIYINGVGENKPRWLITHCELSFICSCS